MADNTPKPEPRKYIPSTYGPGYRADHPSQPNHEGKGIDHNQPVVGITPELPTTNRSSIQNHSSSGGILGGAHMGGNSDVGANIGLGGITLRTPQAPRSSSGTKFPSLKKTK